MSDIWVKTTSGTANSAWKKAVNIFVKTASGTGSAAWSTVKNVYVRFSAGWTRVWPLSGVFNVTSPYITTSSGSTTPLYGVDGPRRVGQTLWGKNGTWNANGWVINSYQYRWRTYLDSNVNDLNLDSQTALATYSAATSLSIPATYDRKWLSFFIQANSSGGTAYNGYAESGVEYGALQIVRQQPINLSASLSTNSPQVGAAISFSSSWDTTAAYLPEAARTTITWYKNLTYSTIGGTQVSYGSYSYTPVSSDVGYYLYAVEECFNSGTDYDLGLNTGVQAKVITTNTVGAGNKTPPDIISATQSTPGGTLNVVVSGGSGPAYQIYWTASSTPPGASSQPDGGANASGGSTTTVTDNTGVPSTGTWYVFARSTTTAGFTTSDSGNSATTQYSQWAPNPGYQFFVTATRYLYFNQNTTDSVSNMPSTQSAVDSGSGAAITISNNTPTRAGFTFAGWNTLASGAGTNYSAGGSITISSDTTLYAKWTANNLTAPTNVQVTGSAGNHSVSFSGGSGPYFQVYWTTVSTTNTTTYDQSGYSSPITVTNLVNPSGGTTYYFFVRSVSALSNVGTGPSSTISSWSSPGSWTAPVSPPSLTSFTISPTTPTVGTTITVTANWANNPTSTSTKITRGTANVISSESTVAGPNASNTASYTIQSGDVGLYLAGFSTASNSGGTTGPSKTTSPVEIGPVTQPFTPPSSGTPSWSAGTNFQRIAGSSILRWYTDYPSISGNGSFTGMQFEIRTTAGGGTLLASGTRSYPGAGTYPYSGGGTVWAFRCGTSDGDISYSSSARYARVRTVMLGTNGTTYYGSWTGWI